jgi:two-component system chemotaxis response regulator CheB
MKSFDLIAIGCSLGGMKALQTILTSFAPEFCVPIAVVQHRYKESNEALPAHLRRSTHMRVVDVEDGQPVKEGYVYLAPANYHLLVEKGRFSLSVDLPVTYSRPSIDVLFESAADAYRDKLVGVVLTGASADGAKGSMRIKRRGGFVVAQDPKTAEAPVMPQAAITAGSVDRILPLDRIGPFLVELCHLRAGRVVQRR